MRTIHDVGNADLAAGGDVLRHEEFWVRCPSQWNDSACSVRMSVEPMNNQNDPVSGSQWNSSWFLNFRQRHLVCDSGAGTTQAASRAQPRSGTSSSRCHWITPRTSISTTSGTTTGGRWYADRGAGSLGHHRGRGCGASLRLRFLAGRGQRACGVSMDDVWGNVLVAVAVAIVVAVTVSLALVEGRGRQKQSRES